ncbi:MAG TPA: hypothetical protein VFW98_10085, partial [Gemmatimonadaceae bacterium]|nr:hypothetical protein [Gemmatimonadaceae bacterium]
AIGENPKVWRFARALFPRRAGKLGDVIHAAAVGHLTMLLGMAKIHAPDGRVERVPDELLETWAKWRGAPGDFAAAWRAEFATDGTIHDWEEWNGDLIKKQEKERRRWHLRKERGASRGGTDGVSSGVSAGDSTEGPPETPPAPTHPPTHQPTNHTSKTARRVRAADGADDGFAAAWAMYPARAGGNPSTPAEKAWRATVRSGVDPGDLMRATKHYAEYIRASGKEQTEYVMQGATFYGPNKRWREFLEAMSAAPARNGAFGRRPTPQQYAPYDTSGNEAVLRRMGLDPAEIARQPLDTEEELAR